MRLLPIVLSCIFLSGGVVPPTSEAKPKRSVASKSPRRNKKIRKPSSEQERIASIKRNFDRAVSLYRKDQLKQAEVAFKQLLVKVPTHFLAMNYLGNIYVRTNRISQAVSIVEKSVRIIPERQSFRLLAVVYSLDGQWDKAERAYRILLRADPFDPDLLLDLGVLFANSKRFDDAHRIVGVLDSIDQKEKAMRLYEYILKAVGSEAVDGTDDGPDVDPPLIDLVK